MEHGVRRIKEFYQKYLPLGDRLAEAFYAVWMVVVTLGLLGNIEGTRGEVLLVIAIAFSVNLTWGIIDGLSVMYGNVIGAARNDQMVYDLQTLNDRKSRKSARAALDDTVISGLSEVQKERILDEIAAGSRSSQDPHTVPYHPSKDDWRYALGIVAIDASIVLPLVVPLLVSADLKEGIYWSRLVATVIMALLGAAYAKNLHRRRWAAALFLAALGFAVFTWSYELGW